VGLIVPLLKEISKRENPMHLPAEAEDIEELTKDPVAEVVTNVTTVMKDLEEVVVAVREALPVTELLEAEVPVALREDTAETSTVSAQIAQAVDLTALLVVEIAHSTTGTKIVTLHLVVAEAADTETSPSTNPTPRTISGTKTKTMMHLLPTMNAEEVSRALEAATTVRSVEAVGVAHHAAAKKAASEVAEASAANAENAVSTATEAVIGKSVRIAVGEVEELPEISLTVSPVRTVKTKKTVSAVTIKLTAEVNAKREAVVVEDIAEAISNTVVVEISEAVVVEISKVVVVVEAISEVVVVEEISKVVAVEVISSTVVVEISEAVDAEEILKAVDAEAISSTVVVEISEAVDAEISKVVVAVAVISKAVVVEISEAVAVEVTLRDLPVTSTIMNPNKIPIAIMPNMPKMPNKKNQALLHVVAEKVVTYHVDVVASTEAIEVASVVAAEEKVDSAVAKATREKIAPSGKITEKKAATEAVAVAVTGKTGHTVVAEKVVTYLVAEAAATGKIATKAAPTISLAALERTTKAASSPEEGVSTAGVENIVAEASTGDGVSSEAVETLGEVKASGEAEEALLEKITVERGHSTIGQDIMTGKRTVDTILVVAIKAVPLTMTVLPQSQSSVALPVVAVDAAAVSSEKSPPPRTSQVNSTQQFPPSSQNTTTIRTQNLNVPATTTVAVALRAVALAVDSTPTRDLLHLFLEAVLREVVVALVALAAKMTSNLLMAVTSKKSTEERLRINHAVDAADISTKTRTRMVGMTSSVSSKKLVNSISHANIVTTIVEEVADAVKPLDSETSATASTHKGRSAKAMVRSSLLTMAAIMSSCLPLEEGHVEGTVAWAA
jgi:hypothetical protein